MFWSIANWGLSTCLSPRKYLHQTSSSRSNPKAVLSSVYTLHLFSRLRAWGGDNVPFKYIFMKVRLKTLNANSTRRHAARPLRPLLIRDIEVKGRVDQPRRKVYGKLGDGATALH